jgi:hypothetical protein
MFIRSLPYVEHKGSVLCSQDALPYVEYKCSVLCAQDSLAYVLRSQNSLACMEI